MNTLQKAILALIGAVAISSPAQGQMYPYPPDSIAPANRSTQSTQKTTLTTYEPREQFMVLENYEMMDLAYRQVPAVIARGYNPRFFRGVRDPNATAEITITLNAAECIERLYKAGVDPDLANSYPQKFSTFEVIDLFKNGFKPIDLWVFKGSLAPKGILEADEKAQAREQFDDRFSLEKLSLEQVLAIKKNPRFTPATAREYAQRFSAGDVLSLIDSVSAVSANGYNSRFGAGDIGDLAKNGITPPIADSYPAEFPATGVVRLYKEGISGQTARGYTKLNAVWALHLDYMAVSNCKKWGISAQDLEAKVRAKKMDELLAK